MRHDLKPQRGALINIDMRFYEFNNIKPLKTLNPAQARIASLKRSVEMAKNSLRRERQYQKRKTANQQLQKLSQQKIKP
jgi:hypothetical protein